MAVITEGSVPEFGLQPREAEKSEAAIEKYRAVTRGVTAWPAGQGITRGKTPEYKVSRAGRCRPGP